MEKKNAEEKEVHHGVQKVGGFPVHEKCTYCIFHETVADYIFLIPGQRICRYNTYGIEFTSFPLDNLFSKIMYVKFATVFLGWTPNRKHIFTYDEKFTELGVITSNFSLVNIIIDNSLLQMIFVGEKYISIYEMSSKGVFIEKRRFKINFDKNICFDENKIEQSILVYFNVGEQELFCSFGRHGCIIDIKKENITSYKMCMHQFRITAILFYPNFNWIVTGDEKGTIQSWDSTWTITMKIIGLKTAQFLSFDPTTNDIFAIGMNQMIIWNAAYKDKTQEIQFKKTVTSFTFNEFDNHLLTLSDKAIVWHNKTLCHLHCIQRAPATVLRSMHYPEWKWLTLVATADGTVQIINPDSGKQLTTLTGSYLKHRNLISYSCVLGTLYIVLCNQKQIIVSSSKSNPMEVKNKLKLPHNCLVTSMTVFEYLPRKESQKHIIVHSSAIILIILGMSDGNIVVLFPHLKIKQQMHVHGSPVLQLVALVNRNHLLSYEESNIIKLWKVAIVSKKYPLLPSMTFYYPNSIIHIAAIGATLCIVTENITRPNDILFMYNFETRTQWDHSQCDDHESKICSISSNEQLQLCATSSVDRTIRIWDKENHLLKILFLHAQPNLITFSLPRGDIIVNIGKHLYRINSESYLPHKYEEMTQSLQMTEEHDKTSHDIMYLDEHQEDYNPSIANSLLQKLVAQKYKDPLIRQKINYYNSRNKDILDLVNGKQTSKVHSVVNRKHHFLYNKTTYVELLQHSDSTPIRKELDLSPIDIKRLREKQKAKIMNIHNKFASLSERNIADLRSLYPASNYYIPDFNMFIPNSVAFKMMEPIINVFEIQASKGRSGKLEKINYENSFTITFSDMNETNTSSSLPIQPENTFVSYHMTEVHAETSISSNVRLKTTRNWETESIKNNSIIIHCLKNAQKEKEILTLNETDKCLFDSPECITFPAEEKGFFNNTQELFDIGGLKDSLNLNGPDLPKTNQPKEASERKLHYNKTNYHEAELESRSRIEIEERINYSQNELFNTLSDLWNNAKHDGDYNNILKILQKLGIVSEELLGENKKQILDFLLMESCKGNKEVTSILTLFASGRDEDKIYVENEILQMLNNVTKNKTPFRNVPGTVKALKLTDVDVVAAMLVQYILSTKSARKSIFEYFISIGLNDPDCVIKQYSIDWKNDLLKQCSKKKKSEIDYAIANKIVTKWLQFWMDSLEYHTNEILKLLLQDHELTCDVDRFLLDELERMINRKILQPTKSEHTSLIENTMDIDMPRNVTEMTVFIDTNSLRIVQGNVKPIEGLNYFCEVHNKQKTPLRRVSVKHTQTCFADIQKISEEKLNSNLKAHKPWKVFLHKPLPAVQVGNSDPYPVPSLLTLRTSQKYFWPDSSIAKMQDLAIFNDVLRIE